MVYELPHTPMSLVFSLSPASDIPIYRQIVQHIRRAIAQGHLELGEQLPAVRVLAESLVVNPNTVARAYQDLIRDGMLESRSGIGVFVAEKLRQVFSQAERERRLAHAIEQVLFEALLLDFPLPTVRSALEEQWKIFKRNSPPEGKK
jgi:GntR family transcriptional regulator